MPFDRSFAVPFVLAFGAHVAVVWTMPVAQRTDLPEHRASTLIDVSIPPLREMPPAPELPPPSAAAAQRRAAPARRRAPRPMAQPAPAVSGGLDPSAGLVPEPAVEPSPLDFSSGPAFGSTGTSTARAGVATSPIASIGHADRSRRASIAGGLEWRCPFPSQADTHGINRAVVRLRVWVGSDGRAQRVRLTDDPGYGFGRAAEACALARYYEPALDRDGRPAASGLDVALRFVR